MTDLDPKARERAQQWLRIRDDGTYTFDGKLLLDRVAQLLLQVQAEGLEAMRWACMDAITGAQRDGRQFKRAFPDGLNDARQFNIALCEPVDEIEKITLESLEKDHYFDIARRELEKKRSQAGAE